MLDEKSDGVTAAAATEALVKLFGLGERKGGRLFVMERAKTQVTVSSSLQFDEFTDDIYDVNTVQYLLYGMWGDQGCEDTKEPVAFDGSFEEQLIYEYPAFIALAAMPCRKGSDRIGLHPNEPVAAGWNVHIQYPVHGGAALDRHFR